MSGAYHLLFGFSRQMPEKYIDLIASSSSRFLLQFIILQIIPKLGIVNFKLVKAPLNKVQTKILESLAKFLYLRTTL